MKHIHSLLCATLLAVSTSAQSLVEPPAGIQLVEATANVTSKDWGWTEEYTVYVGQDGDNIYIGGLFRDEGIGDSWIQGELQGDHVIFPAAQYIGQFGSDGYTYAMYANGIDMATGSMCDYIMERDPETGNLSSTSGVQLASTMEYAGAYYALDQYTQITITLTDNTVRQLVEVPASATHYAYNVQAFETVSSQPVEYEAELAFDGEDVYLGYFSMISQTYQSYIKGRVEGGRLIFGPDQYLGTDPSEEGPFHFYMYGSDYDGNVTVHDLVFEYNVEDDRYTAQSDMLITVGQITSSTISFIENLTDLVLQGDFSYDPNTGMHNIQTEAPAPSPAYDLQGRRLTKPQRGIMIQGGKKVVR